MEPDCLIVHEPTLFRAVDIFAGLRPDGYLLVNTNKALTEAHVQTDRRKPAKGTCRHRPGDGIRAKAGWRRAAERRPARRICGSDGLVRLDSVKRAIGEAFPGEIGAANIAAAEEAYEFVMSQESAA